MSAHLDIYISGKISGLKDLNWSKFKTIELALQKKLTQWVTVHNPHSFPALHDKSWRSYMKVCIAQLMRCSHVLVLDDWKQSRGAILEVILAHLMGIPVYDAYGFLHSRETARIEVGGWQLAWLFVKVLLNRF